MITAALSRRSQELAAAGVEFVTATVVRAQSPSSVEAGSVGLVLGDGTIEGFVGGGCAEQSVRAYSLLALQSGEPVLLRILPDAVEGDAGPEGVEIASEDGAVTVRNPCLSGGVDRDLPRARPARSACPGRWRHPDSGRGPADRRGARARDGDRGR